MSLDDAIRLYNNKEFNEAYYIFNNIVKCKYDEYDEYEYNKHVRALDYIIHMLKYGIGVNKNPIKAEKIIRTYTEYDNTIRYLLVLYKDTNKYNKLCKWIIESKHAHYIFYLIDNKALDEENFDKKYIFNLYKKAFNYYVNKNNEEIMYHNTDIIIDNFVSLSSYSIKKMFKFIIKIKNNFIIDEFGSYYARRGKNKIALKYFKYLESINSDIDGLYFTISEIYFKLKKWKSINNLYIKCKYNNNTTVYKEIEFQMLRANPLRYEIMILNYKNKILIKKTNIMLKLKDYFNNDLINYIMKFY